MLDDDAGLRKRASRDADGVSAKYLGTYPQTLAEISQTGRGLNERDIQNHRELGIAAAQAGVPMRALVDLYLSATWLAWPRLSGVRDGDASTLRSIGEAVFRAADAAIVAVTGGYEDAQRWAVRQEESQRREFIDDLLDGRRIGQLADRAERYGVRLAGSHIVAAVRSSRRFVDGADGIRRIESAMLVKYGPRDILITTKDGLLVCLATTGSRQVFAEFERLVEAIAPDDWRMGIGKQHSGPRGAMRSMHEATDALDIADRMALPHRVSRSSDLLVYQVLSRDSAAMHDLVTEVLGPLMTARRGGMALLETLRAYFRVGSVATAAARDLNVGVRTVTYRLGRIRELTGYGVDDPEQSFTLQTAVTGALLIGWPAEE
ncbi:DNA-binding PucR family transcriptional regulator [Stackebrandtia endophytica]|uniref:DNA-binding PucR family transcriptional regulator n=1 Tax=Stackebrandtia endophytica TaxID=1496996 RepID=A0A543AQV9_9ACTN|nr:helix-turn-helix domain-containing protein [Stackebrandtia endophytica]TQL74925.1 DNA-binding PucR family transcriptional regulator [Stackebrandtia endophytica]